MIVSLAFALLLGLSPNDKGYRIMSEMLGALKDVHSVELKIEGEDLVKGPRETTLATAYSAMAEFAAAHG